MSLLCQIIPLHNLCSYDIGWRVKEIQPNYLMEFLKGLTTKTASRFHLIQDPPERGTNCSRKILGEGPPLSQQAAM